MTHFANPISVTLEYADVDGIQTRRYVDIFHADARRGHTVLTAFCHGRQSERSFRSDRISAVILDDGEVLHISEFLAQLSRHRAEPTHKLVAIKPGNKGPRKSRLRQLGRLAFLIGILTGVILAGVFVVTKEFGLAFAVLALIWVPLFALRWLAENVARLFSTR